jgi:hypothetical protein
MPFCHSPWTNIDISPQGGLSPCCKFIHLTPPLNIKNNTIDDYFNSQALKETKESFNNNQWPAGCDRCRIEEENQIESKRILDYKRWKDDYDNYRSLSKNFITASVAFGNTCNLTCITCGPQSSSRWHKEFDSVYQVNIQPNHFYKSGFVEDFLKATPDLIHIDIPGGEPFLSGIAEQKFMLTNWIASGKAKDISIHYTTNVTVFPDSEWWDLWKHFKHVDIQLSIDGVGKRAEYIRYPSSWSAIVENTQQYLVKLKLMANLQISVSHTVSAYNIYYLDEFFTWCNSMGLPRPWLGKVHNPAHMRSTIWSKDAQKFIIEHLMSSQNSDVHVWAQLISNIDDSSYFDEFKLRTQQHDSYRNLSFADTFPEMNKWMT